MKILIITQYFWPENFKINDFALRVSELGHEIIVLTGIPNYPSGKFYPGYSILNKRTEHYERIKIIRTLLISRGRGTGFRLMTNYFSFAFFSSLAAIFRLKHDADVVFVYEPSPITVAIPAIFYKFFSKSPVFLWVQDLWPESLTAAGKVRSRSVLILIDTLVKFIYKKTDVIFVSSKSFKASIVSKGIDQEKIKYLPNWAEDLFLSTNYNEIKKFLPKDGFNIVFAGNIGDAQDFESIVEAVATTNSYKKINWIIVGDGRKKAWLEKQKIDRELTSIYLIGRHSLELMPQIFSEADALLVSLRNELIFSLTVPAKVQAYMACGKPILAMMNGEGADIIRESKAGFAVDAGDYKKLSEKAVEMAGLSKIELHQMSLRAKEYYQLNFNREDLISFVLAEFVSLLNK